MFERGEHRAGGDEDDCEIDRRADVGDRFVANEAVDLGVVRVHRIDFSGILVLAQHRQQAPRNLLVIARSTDQRDAGGCKEAVERMRHVQIPIVGLARYPRHGRACLACAAEAASAAQAGQAWP
ncbi:hypothetical protein ACVWZ6_009380 [Bradyrhizobium sp. GM6.1]